MTCGAYPSHEERRTGAPHIGEREVWNCEDWRLPGALPRDLPQRQFSDDSAIGLSRRPSRLGSRGWCPIAAAGTARPERCQRLQNGIVDLRLTC